MKSYEINYNNPAAQSLKAIIGIHQNGNEATVYYVITPAIKHVMSNLGLSLVRLNSGKWLIQGGDKHMNWQYLRK